MLKRLWDLLWGTEEAPATPTESFGGVAVDSSLGLAILSDPKRQELCRSIWDSLYRIPREERVELVDRLILRFALYVLDLQASEKHHDARPYGLLDHSLAVALQVAQKVGRPVFRVSEDPVVQHRDHPRWQYAAMVSALLHDVGKVLDLEVTMPQGKDRWNPHAEPLAQFCARNGLNSTGPRFWSYRAGRGLRFHSWHGPMVFPLVLTPKITAYLGERLTLLSDAMIVETLERAPEAPHPIAARVAKLIHEFDIEASKSSRGAEASVARVPEVAPAAPERPASPPAAPLPPEDPAPPAPTPRPPLDLGKVLADFTDALSVAVKEGWIPLNQEGGLYIGRKHVYLQSPEGMDCVIDLMIRRGSDLRERFEEDAAGHPDESCGDFTPTARVIQALLAHGRMPYSNAQWFWVQQATIAHPGDSGPPWEGLVVLMNMPFPDLPRFEGKLNLFGIGDPESDSATNPLQKRPEKAPPAPVLRRCREEAYELRVSAELEPDRLQATLRGAIRSGVFHRPGAWSPVYLRPDFIWVLVPEAFKILIERMGIRFTDHLENALLRSIERIPKLARSEAGRTLFRIKVFPESQESVWAIALGTAGILSPEEVAALGPWDQPIRVIESLTPGEYAA
jgi:hypothetical protein